MARAIVKTIPAPVGGLNDISSIADMPPTDALVMDNVFPGTSSCTVRGGALRWAVAAGLTGETLLAYNGISTKKLFMAASSNIYDVTAANVVTLVVASQSNARWDSINFGGTSGNHLVAVNGADLPVFYNGSTWVSSGTGYAAAITGVDAKLFASVAVFKNRLYFVQKNSLKCWYLGTNAIGGAASSIDFSGVARLGGKLVAITTIPSSAGYSLDDYFCAITSEGEMLVYKGTDPASSSTFALVGVYQVGRPIANGAAIDGSRFIAKVGADIVAITIDGFTTLQNALNNDVVAQDKQINKKIINSVTRDTGNYKDYFGWQIILAPNQNKLIINVPIGGGEYYQYIMNTITGAWCRFTGLNALCWAYFNDDLWSVMSIAGGCAVFKMEQAGRSDDNTALYFPLHTVAFTQVTSSGSRIWRAIGTDDNAKYICAVSFSDGRFNSYDSGVTWYQTSTGSGLNWPDCAVSATGKIQISMFTGSPTSDGQVHISYNYGVTWATIAGLGNGYYLSCAMSSDGQTIAVTKNASYLKISRDAGATWTTLTAGPQGGYVKVSGDGSVFVVGDDVVYSSSVWVSTNDGVSFTSRPLPDAGHGTKLIALSKTGTVIYVCGYLTSLGAQYIYKSEDYGVTWTKLTASNDQPRYSISMSRGNDNRVIDGGAAINYISDDKGATWTNLYPALPTIPFAGAAIALDSNTMFLAMHNSYIYKGY